MGEIRIVDLIQFVGGASLLSLAVATLKFVRDFRDELRDLRKDLGRTDIPAPTGTIGKVLELERELREIRDWAVRQGYDQRKS